MSKLQTFRAKLDDNVLRASIIGAGLLAPVLSFAQSTDPFDTVKADATAKITTYGGGLVVVAGVGVVFMIAMKYVKKIPRAA